MLPSKQNIVTEAIGFIFLFVQKDIDHPRYCITELTEHTFGELRIERSEATVEETIWI